MKEGGRIIQRLHRLYGKEPFKRDKFGRRKALSREIEVQTGKRDPKFPDDLDKFTPTQKDLEEKKD